MAPVAAGWLLVSYEVGIRWPWEQARTRVGVEVGSSPEQAETLGRHSCLNGTGNNAALCAHPAGRGCDRPALAGKGAEL